MKKLLMALACATTLSACAVTQTPMVHTIEMKDIDFSKSAMIKEGESCSISLFGLVGPFGDVKLVDAIKNGDINKVTNYDYSRKHFILFSRDCVRAYGY